MIMRRALIQAGRTLHKILRLCSSTNITAPANSPSACPQIAMVPVGAVARTSPATRTALRATRVQFSVCFSELWKQPQSMSVRPRLMLTAMATANSASSAAARPSAQGERSPVGNRMPTTASRGGRIRAKGTTSGSGSNR